MKENSALALFFFVETTEKKHFLFFVRHIYKQANGRITKHLTKGHTAITNCIIKASVSTDAFRRR